MLAGYLAFAALALATEPEVYPAKGQTQQQQERDQFECHEWATKDTGVDPVALAEQHLGTPAPARQEGMGARRVAPVSVRRVAPWKAMPPPARRAGSASAA
jgi:hypothetical protein